MIEGRGALTRVNRRRPIPAWVRSRASRAYFGKSVISVLFGKRTELVLSFPILGVVDNIHVEKPVQAEAGYRIGAKHVGIPLRPFMKFRAALRVPFADVVADDGTTAFTERAALVMLIGQAALHHFAPEAEGQANDFRRGQ